MSKIWSLLVLSRAHFLAGGLVMFVMGAIVAQAEGASLQLVRVAWGQIGVSAIQLMTHLFNEHYDAERDGLVTTRTLFSGGSGVLPAGRLENRVAVRGAMGCALVGIIVTLSVGWPVGAVYAVGLIIGYSYSAPPLRLMTRGLGEIAASVTVALLSPMAGYGVAAGRLSDSIIWLGLPLLATSIAFMITVELPDYEADRSTGKRNWVARWGRERAATLHNGLLALSYLLLAAVAQTGQLPSRVVNLLWLTTPVAIWQMGGAWIRARHGWRQYTLLAGGGLVLVGLYGILAGIGYLF